MNTHLTKAVKHAALLLSVCMAGALSGCSSSPSVGDGERAVQDRIKQESEGRIKLVKFEKTNGLQAEVGGVKTYAMEFTAEIEFTEDCKWVTGMFGMQLGFRTSKPLPKGANALEQFRDASMNTGDLFAKGQKAQVSGVVRFVKKERGWALEALELTHANASAG